MYSLELRSSMGAARGGAREAQHIPEQCRPEGQPVQHRQVASHPLPPAAFPSCLQESTSRVRTEPPGIPSLLKQTLITLHSYNSVCSL